MEKKEKVSSSLSMRRGLKLRWRPLQKEHFDAWSHGLPFRVADKLYQLVSIVFFIGDNKIDVLPISASLKCRKDLHVHLPSFGEASSMKIVCGKPNMNLGAHPQLDESITFRDDKITPMLISRNGLLKGKRRI